ncbi:AsmA family protein [Eikenella sp. S3360]|uniref:AsmA family protein n=1 Tax=Eikenella glucosivorans TaxID=2766967 RepID=A0ABS0NBA2_9NEIS|nr:AsmA family protein [Eikenella glucosivorans]MBH5329529.1 AsmA family protein [Eikenella glucosivorans]
MIKLLYSGKFWLKTMCFGLLVPLLLWLGAHFGLKHLFSEAHIRQTANTVLAGSGRQFAFDGGQIERGWFPYPYVVLHQVGLTRPQNQGPALNAETVRLSFGWSALWGDTDIRSLSLNGATVFVQRLDGGRWEVAGFTSGEAGNHTLPQRIELDNSNLRIQYGEQKQSLRQVSGFIDRGDGNFDLAASLFAPQEYRLQAAGSYDGSHIEQLQASLAGFLPGGQSFTASWQGNADYAAEQSRLNTKEGRLNMQIPGWALNIEGNTRNWQLSPTGAVLPETHIVFTTEQPESGQDAPALLHSGSGSINKASYQNRTLEIGGFQISGTFEQNGANSSYSANGRLKAEPGSFQADNLFLNTRHTAAPNSMPSWVGQWSGSISGKAGSWQAQLQGSLDNNEGYLKISGRPGEQGYSIDAEAKLAKLALGEYLPGSSDGAENSDPLWLRYWPQALRDRQIKLALDIGSLEGSGLQIQNFHSTLRLDADQLRADDIRMQLYDGQATGSAVLHAGNRPKWQAILNFNNIQIKPLLQDAFRFNHLSGHGNAAFQISAEGLKRSEWHTTLAGEGRIMLDNGAWQGINLAKLLNQPAPLHAQSLIRYNAESSTPFRHFSIEARVENGIGTTPRLSLQSDSLNLSGQGSFDIRNNSLNYAVLASAGRNLWLPLKINGSISRPSFALDYQRITSNLQTPEQKQRALQDVLQQQWQWIQNLPENTQP